MSGKKTGNYLGTMTAVEPHHLAVIDAVRTAGGQLLAMQPRVRRARQAVVKEDGTIVTPADFASQETLLEAIDLHAAHPHVVVCEEGERGPVDRPGRSTWFVDPLDGTRGYAAGSTDFAVLVSEWSADLPEFSVVYYPALGDLAVAVGDWATATLSSSTARQKIARPSAVIQTCYLSPPAVRQVFDDTGSTARCEDGAESTRALLNVATGTATAAIVLLCGHKSWDLAPLLHLITASGGQVSDENGAPLLLNGSDVSGKYVVAAQDPSLHETLTGTAQRLIEHGL